MVKPLYIYWLLLKYSYRIRLFHFVPSSLLSFLSSSITLYKSIIYTVQNVCHTCIHAHVHTIHVPGITTSMASIEGSHVQVQLQREKVLLLLPTVGMLVQV